MIYADISQLVSLFCLIWDLFLFFLCVLQMWHYFVAWRLRLLLCPMNLLLIWRHLKPYIRAIVMAGWIWNTKLQVEISHPWRVEWNTVCITSLCLAFCVYDCVRQSELLAPAGISSVVLTSVGKITPTGAVSMGLCLTDHPAHLRLMLSI